MAEVASAFVSLVPSARGFGARIQRQIGGDVEKAGRDGGKKYAAGMGASIRGVGARIFAPIAAAAAGVGVVDFFRDAISGASDLNESATKIQAIFGDGTAAVQEFAAQGAKSLGQTRNDVLDASATFGTFGKAAGLSGVDLAKFSTGFAGLSTDLASFNNTSPEQAVEAIGAALRGESEPIRQYGVLLDDATLRNAALRLGLIKTTKEALTPQQKVLAAQAEIYRQTGDAQGDFARTSGGLANQQRILTATLTDLRTNIGTALLPVVLAITKRLADFVSGMQTGEGAGGALVATVRSLISFFRRYQAIIIPVVAAVGSAVVVFRTLTAVARAYTAVQAALNFVLAANPIGIVIVVVAALAAGLVVAFKRSETFRATVNKAFSSVASAGRAMWNNVLRPTFQFILRGWTSLAGGILEGAARAFSWVPGVGPKLRAAADKFNQFARTSIAALDRVPDTKSVRVSTPGAAEAKRNINNLEAAMRRVKDQAIPLAVAVGVNNKLRANPGLTSLRGNAAGGLIHGPGTGTSDSILGVDTRGVPTARVSAGEFVVNKRSTDLYRPVIEAINAGKFANGGLVGLAAGGSVARLSIREQAQTGAATRQLNALADALKRTRGELAAAAAGGGGGGPGGGTAGGRDAIKAFIRSTDRLPYIWGGVGPGGYDCSGLVGEVYARHTGRPNHRRYFTTGSFPGSAHGFKGGLGGTLSVGITPGSGHMAGEYGGLKFEARSTRTGIFTGPAARSVGSFARKFHLAEGGIVEGGLLEKMYRLGKLVDIEGDGGVTRIDGRRVFDRGGHLLPGQVGANFTSQPERVLTPSNTQSFDRLVGMLERGQVMGGRGTQIENVYAFTPDSLVRQLDERDRRLDALHPVY